MIAGPVLQSLVFPSSSLGLPLSLQPRLQRDFHSPGVSPGSYLSVPPQGWLPLMFTSVSEPKVWTFLLGHSSVCSASQVSAFLSSSHPSIHFLREIWTRNATRHFSKQGVWQLQSHQPPQPIWMMHPYGN